MADPIEVHYSPDGDDWTVAVKGRGQTLTGNAPGLIAARDRADQLVEKLTANETGHKTVVHLLDGDAVAFTTAYLTARLAKTEPEKPAEKPVEVPVEAPTPTATTGKPAEKAATPPPDKTPKPTPAPRPPADEPAAKATEAPAASAP